jgi:HD domain
VAEPTGDDVAPGQHDREWQSRPGLSRALRFAVFGGPIAASFGVALLLGHLLPRATSLSTSFLWVGVIGATSVATLLGVERATRQLLPLAALLNLSLVFPDRAPARFAVARRRGRPSDLRDSLQRAHDRGRLEDAQRLQTVIDLVLALSVHDRASRGHSERVRAFTDLLADELKVPESGRNRLRWAALLHDIGKLEVPSAILNKPASPSEEEWAALHRHPEEGARLVAPLLPWLAEWGLAVEQHHERFDGTGYPHRLRGHEIALAARIVSVADVYEVMTAPRPYKRSMSVTAAREELVRVAGTQLDPAIVRAFLNISVGRLWRTIGFGAWIGQIPTLARLINLSGWAASGTGFVAAAAATVIAVSGAVGPATSPGPDLLSGLGVAVAPSASAGASVPSGPGRTPGGSITGGASPAAPTPSVSSAAPGSHSPAASPTPPLQAGATPSSAPATMAPGPTPPASTPPPTPTAGPSPTSLPATCSACTNTSKFCLSYCNNDKASLCLSWCQGKHNSACTQYCWGNDNTLCVSYCAGANNPVCIASCQVAYLTSSAAASSKSRVWSFTSSRLVTGHIRAMLWNGVIITPRFSM